MAVQQYGFCPDTDQKFDVPGMPDDTLRQSASGTSGGTDGANAGSVRRNKKIQDE